MRLRAQGIARRIRLCLPARPLRRRQLGDCLFKLLHTFIDDSAPMYGWQTAGVVCFRKKRVYFPISKFEPVGQFQIFVNPVDNFPPAFSFRHDLNSLTMSFIMQPYSKGQVALEVPHNLRLNTASRFTSGQLQPESTILADFSGLGSRSLVSDPV